MTIISKKLQFSVEGDVLQAVLYTPERAGNGPLPGVVVTGAWTTVKEQMPTTYAKALAQRGFAALVFDFRGWGQSAGEPRYLEDPARKTEDTRHAARFLASLPEVDEASVYGVGICASSGYMADAVATVPVLQKLALVAPWLHDPEMATQIYGGPDMAQSLIAAGREAASAAEPTYMVAASATDENALMYQAPYYTETDRGMIAAYDNKFNVASWEPWLSYDAQQIAEKLSKATLIVASEAAALPASAHAFVKRTHAPISEVWLDDVSQFDFYDKPAVVEQVADELAVFFKSEG
ncbi:alpha/beta hydrolase [Pseudovibrio sp. SPO723]|uniref:alpha/beta hydrolase n=1 Tax=Nesiotobacter zosterae TaxID=392721 RepID=UPI0029C4084D|nr:alpha/beta hydrolase [Pseudovibrio sp. SPO723]MDX5594250.1 alpha/beta hydrolase [Pseudovibrio sp. SPO723]